jgi:uncharacterized protein (TIGR03437 family)
VARLILILALAVISALGQGANTIVSAGYLYPGPTFVAPGQVITIFASGVGAGLTQPVVAGAGKLPTALAGISVTLVQSTNVPVPTLSLVPEVLAPNFGVKTAITIQIPYELEMLTLGLGPGPPSLFVTENGASGNWSGLFPQTDQVHILTTCDIAIGGSGLARCPWEVTHADGQLVSTDNPAVDGEELVAYATGLGATNPAARTGQAATQPAPAAGTFRLSFNFQADALPAAPQQGSGNLSAPLFAGLVPGFAGLYQINFVVPAVPAGLPACAGQGLNLVNTNLVNTNMTVSIGGATSFDGAELCVSVPK